MKLRSQLPVRSPLSLATVAAGVGGWLAPDRQALERLAAELRATFGARDVLLADSGTSALRLAIQQAMAERPGGAVALPAWGCYDLATAADGAGAPVVLYDVSPGTLGPDPESLRRALIGEVAAVVVAHFHGMPADLDAVQAAADAAGALLIEDAAQGVGATLRGRRAGAIGPLAVLSFSRGKGVTGGGGGALLANRSLDRIMQRARAGLGPAPRGTREIIGLAGQWLLGRPALYGLPSALPFLSLGRTIYHPPRPPRGMPAAAAAALRVAWPEAMAEVEVRCRNVASLLPAVPAHAVVAPLEGAEPSWLRLPVLAGAAAATAADGAAAHALGIFRGYPLSLVDLPGFGARVVNRDAGFPGARQLASSLVTLPTHGLLGDADRSRLARWLATV